MHFVNKYAVMNNMHRHIQKTLPYKQVASTGIESSSDSEYVVRKTDAETPLSSCYRCELPAIERGSNTDAYCA